MLEFTQHPRQSIGSNVRHAATNDLRNSRIREISSLHDLSSHLRICGFVGGTSLLLPERSRHDMSAEMCPAPRPRSWNVLDPYSNRPRTTLYAVFRVHSARTHPVFTLFVHTNLARDRYWQEVYAHPALPPLTRRGILTDVSLPVC
jgi:hypothetical protein